MKNTMQTCSTFLQTKFFKSWFEFVVIGKKGNLEVDTRTHSGTQVTWAGQNISKMLIPHVFVSQFLHVLFYLIIQEFV